MFGWTPVLDVNTQILYRPSDRQVRIDLRRTLRGRRLWQFRDRYSPGGTDFGRDRR